MRIGLRLLHTPLFLMCLIGQVLDVLVTCPINLLFLLESKILASRIGVVLSMLAAIGSFNIAFNSFMYGKYKTGLIALIVGIVGMVVSFF